MAQMPEEGRRFTQVDKSWRDVMREAVKDTHVLEVIKIDKMLDKMQKGESDEMFPCKHVIESDGMWQGCNIGSGGWSIVKLESEY